MRTERLGAKAVFPGTFDPVTYGHLDLIARGAALFDRLIVLVAENPKKERLFTAEERVALIAAEVAGLPNVSVEASAGLTVEFVKRKGFSTILRGIRTTGDFEHEYRMAQTNRALAPTVETVFLASSLPWSYLSSSLIREVAASGGPVEQFVPAGVAAALFGKRG